MKVAKTRGAVGQSVTVITGARSCVAGCCADGGGVL